MLIWIFIFSNSQSINLFCSPTAELEAQLSTINTATARATLLEQESRIRSLTSKIQLSNTDLTVVTEKLQYLNQQKVCTILFFNIYYTSFQMSSWKMQLLLQLILQARFSKAYFNHCKSFYSPNTVPAQGKHDTSAERSEHRQHRGQRTGEKTRQGITFTLYF